MKFGIVLLLLLVSISIQAKQTVRLESFTDVARVTLSGSEASKLFKELALEYLKEPVESNAEIVRKENENMISYKMGFNLDDPAGTFKCIFNKRDLKHTCNISLYSGI